MLLIISKTKKMKIIQFLHPGSEHSCNTGSNWNMGAHRRKYLELSGKYLADLKSEPISAEKLYFWGEWEAQSHCRAINAPIPNGPEFIFNPFYRLPLPVNAANTDPFVFGDQFYYCICKQPHYHSLRNLNPGDLILFGSCKNFLFVLDTVFVVKRKIIYKIEELNSIMQDFNKSFADLSLLPLCDKEKCATKFTADFEGCLISDAGDNEDDNSPVNNSIEYSIYEAVMYEDRNNFNGMFSYAPCLTNDNGEVGFARPEINIPNIISPKLNQGLKISETKDAHKVWLDVTKTIVENNLHLMTHNSII